MTSPASATGEATVTEKPTDEIKGRTPSEIDLEWIRYGHDLIRKSSEEIEKKAEKIITLSTSIIAFSSIVFTYLGVIGYSIFNISYFVYLLPILFFFLSIMESFSALDAKKYSIPLDDPEKIRKCATEITDKKFVKYNNGKLLFLFGLAIFSLSLLFYNVNFNLGSPIKMEISSENIQTIEALSIKFIENSNCTQELSLVKETSGYYFVNNGGTNLIGIKKEFVRGITFLTPEINHNIIYILPLLPLILFSLPIIIPIIFSLSILWQFNLI